MAATETAPTSAAGPTRARARAVAGYAVRHPSVWAWPAAAVLAGMAHGSVETGEPFRDYYLPALGLVLLGCLPSLFTRPPARPAERSLVPRGVLIALTVVLLAGAAAVRLSRIDRWPPAGIGFEEIQLAARADSGRGWAQNLIATYSPPTEHALTAYATSLSFGLLGTGYLPMRLPYIIGGIVAVFLFFALCRRLVAWEVALFATGLLAVSWWEIAASRVADEIFFPLWLETAVLWLLVDFEDTGRAWVAYLLALSSGLLIYEYSAYHVVAPVIAGYLLARGAGWALRLRRGRSPSEDRRRQAIAALRAYGAGIVALILVWAILARIQLVGDLRLGKESWFLEAVRRHETDTNGLLAHLGKPDALGAFVLHKLAVPLRGAFQPGYGDFCRYLGIGRYPMFDRATAAAIALGAVLVALTPWRRLHALTLIWAVLIFLPAALLPENPNLHRFYVELPLLFLCVALGGQVLWERLRSNWTRAALLGVFAATLLYAGAVNLAHLYGVVMRDPELLAAWRWPRTEIINWVRARDRDAWICIVADDERSVYGASPMQPEWTWLLDGWRHVFISRGGAECIRAPHRERGARFYVLALADAPTDLAALLRAHHPGARELAPIDVPLHHFVARTFFVPPPPSPPAPPRADLPPNWALHGHR